MLVGNWSHMHDFPIDPFDARAFSEVGAEELLKAYLPQRAAPERGKRQSLAAHCLLHTKTERSPDSQRRRARLQVSLAHFTGEVAHDCFQRLRELWVPLEIRLGIPGVAVLAHFCEHRDCPQIGHSKLPGGIF